MDVDKDLNYAFALSRQCLRMLGVWPDPRIPLSSFRLSSIRFLIIVCMLSFYVTVPQFINVIRVWGNVGRIVENIAAANMSLIALTKLITTWYHSETLRTLMTSIKADWMNLNNRERNTMLRLARCGRSLSSRYYAIATITVSFYVCFNLLKFFRIIHQPQRSLVYHFINLYNVQKSPNYEITFIIQLCGGLYTALINCTVDSFVSMLLLHVCGQLINLRMALNKLIDELANESISTAKFKESLAAVAVRHGHLIRNAKTIDNCYSGVLFVHMLATTFQLCFQTFQVYTIIADKLDVSAFKMAFRSFYVILMLMQLYIYCYSAERLSTESSSMAYSVYECKWYNIPAKDAKNLIFIAHGSSIPLRLTAGKFGTFSMEMFGTSVKTAMGYLSMLVTIKG